MKKPSLPIEDIAAGLKSYIHSSKEGFIIHGAKQRDIPIEHLSVLCQYLSAQFVCEMFGGQYQYMLQTVWKYIKDTATGTKIDEDDLTPRYPEGIGGHGYAARLSAQALQALEKIMLAGAGGSNQVVQAARAMLAENDKTQTASVEIMQAYEKQLVILAEHIVEKFLPRLGKSIEKGFKKDIENIIAEISEKLDMSKNAAGELLCEMLFNTMRDGIDKFTRRLSMKKFELLFAKSLSGDDAAKQAFDFAEDLLSSYAEDKAKVYIIEDESAQKILETQGKRGE